MLGHLPEVDHPGQVVLAIVLAIAAIGGLNALAARIYSNSVLRVGSRVKLLEAWRGSA